MSMLRILTCTICGEETLGDTSWFLAMEDHWQDKLIVLHWNDRLAAKQGVYCACSPEHMQEMVVHWMTMGSLAYPFAQVTTAAGRHELRRQVTVPAAPIPDACGAQRIGELSIHRESMERALWESPQSLKTILDALTAALHRERTLGGPGRKPQPPSSEVLEHEV